MRKIPKPDNKKKQIDILVILLFSLLAFILIKTGFSKKTKDLMENMRQASQLMCNSVEAVSSCYKDKGLIIDKKRDVNQTGFIGLERSSITTSLGSLLAKRTSIDPNFAGFFVYLLKQAGVRQGNTVAAGVSGSFPGLIVAFLAAADVLDLNVRMICSLGASQWGANRPDFHWIDMLDCLREKEVISVQPIAFSLGGERDIGVDMDPAGRNLFEERLIRIKVPFIREESLAENVALRMRLYKGSVDEHKIAAFIHIGGSWANMGTDSSVLDLRPGLIRIKTFPAPEKQGVIHAMAAKKIPVIHCLFLRGLVMRYGLTWDPVPLSLPGEGGLYDHVRERRPFFLYIAGVYLICVFVFLYIRGRK